MLECLGVPFGGNLQNHQSRCAGVSVWAKFGICSLRKPVGLQAKAKWMETPYFQVSLPDETKSTKYTCLKVSFMLAKVGNMRPWLDLSRMTCSNWIGRSKSQSKGHNLLTKKKKHGDFYPWGKGTFLLVLDFKQCSLEKSHLSRDMCCRNHLILGGLRMSHIKI